MNGLIGEILTMARLEARAAPQVQEDFDLVALLQSLVEAASFEAKPQEKTVILYTGVVHAPTSGEPRLLSRALENVVRNAIRHSPPTEPITVSMSQAQGFWQVIIRDQGPGVAEEDLAHLFAPFWRAEASSEGFGLGLSIAARAVAYHQGTITARNHPEGGLEVQLSVPCATA